MTSHSFINPEEGLEYEIHRAREDLGYILIDYDFSGLIDSQFAVEIHVRCFSKELRWNYTCIPVPSSDSTIRVNRKDSKDTYVYM